MVVVVLLQEGAGGNYAGSVTPAKAGIQGLNGIAFGDVWKALMR
jgi:hypothetical protein